MRHYRTDDEALVALARQVTDAYREARTAPDQDYACDAIAGFLSEHREHAPAEALLALLDLPLTAETFPLVDEAQMALVARGAESVGPLLAAMAGEVYDVGGPVSQRAGEVLRTLDTAIAAGGLVAALCGAHDDRVKGVALEVLLELGGAAEPYLVAARADPDCLSWVDAALAQVRRARTTGEDGVSQTPS